MAKAPNLHSPGYSLLEMLVVISLLAAVAFIATGNYRNVIEDSGERLVLVEMQEIAGAIRRFKQDTGYFPSEGPFTLSSVAANDDPGDCIGFVSPDGGLDRDGLPPYVATAAEDNWFSSVANFWLLLDQPIFCKEHPLAHLQSWDEDTGRGWRGPYLRGVSDGYVNMGGTIVDVIGLADPFIAKPDVAGIYAWRRTIGGTYVEKWGRPYLMLVVNGKLSLVSMGPDGECVDESDNPVACGQGYDDIVLPLE